jgi:hypothetical protein
MTEGAGSHVHPSQCQPLTGFSSEVGQRQVRIFIPLSRKLYPNVRAGHSDTYFEL